MKAPFGISVIVVVAVLFCHACTERGTEKEYRNNTRVPPETYAEHKAILKDSIQRLVEKGDRPYSIAKGDSLPEIIIDTILYSPDKDKLAFFVIIAHANDKPLVAGSKNKAHYDSYAFNALVDRYHRIHSIVWVSAFSGIDAIDVKSASQDIREMYFKEFREREGKKGESIYKYNWDDVRFWDGPLWKGDRSLKPG